jgi:preprotein translocase subunit SecG
MLYGLVLVVHLFVCFVLIAVILLQAGRGGGLADSFGGGAAQSILGTRGTVYLTRATTCCATIFMLTSVGLAVLSVHRGRSLIEKIPAPVESTARPREETPTEPIPATPDSQPTQESPKQEASPSNP